MLEEVAVPELTKTDMTPVEVSQELLEGLKKIPTATVNFIVRV